MSPDGRWLASGSADGTTLLWDAATGDLRRRFVVGDTGARSPVFSPEGGTLLVGGGTVNSWDVRTGMARPPLPCTDTDNVLAYAAYSPGGDRVAFVSEGDRLMVQCDARSGVLLNSLGGPAGWGLFGLKLGFIRRMLGLPPIDYDFGRILAIAYSPDGRRLATGGMDGRVRLWDAQTGGELLTLKCYTGASHSVAFSPNGKVLAAACNQNVKLWDVDTAWSATTRRVARSFRVRDRSMALEDAPQAKLIADFTGPQVVVKAIAFSPNGRQLVAGRADGVLLSWDPTTSRRGFMLQAGPAAITSVAVSPDGQWLATGASDGQIALRDSKTGQTRYARSGFGSARAVRVSLSLDGRTLGVGMVDGSIRLWDMREGRLRHNIQAHGLPIRSMAISPDGRLLVSGANGDDAAKVWDTFTGRLVSKLGEFTRIGKWDQRLLYRYHNGGVKAVAFSHDGRRVAIGFDFRANLWDPKSGAFIRTIGGLPDGAVEAIAFGKTPWEVVLGSPHECVERVDLRIGELGKELRGTCEMDPPVFSPNGRFVAGWDKGPDPVVLDMATGKRMALPRGIDGTILSFSHDSRALALDKSGRGIELRSLPKGRVAAFLAAPGFTAVSLSFSGDGRYLAAAGDDGAVKVWDLIAGREFASLVFTATRDWLITTPTGAVDGTPGGLATARWNVKGQIYPFAHFASRLQPGIWLRTVSDGGSSGAGKSSRDR